MKYLFKLILSLFLFSTTLYSNVDECKTDIYFGNGVWNSRTEAKISKDELQIEINKNIIKGDLKLQAKYGKVELQYNWSYGDMMDLLETFYQLKETGQIGEEHFFTFVDYLIKTANEDIKDEDIKSMRQQIINMITILEENEVNGMVEKYYEKSFKYGHRVLLVSHSQGNLFANRVYEKINPTKYKNYFANLQVASPASEVKAQKGDYVTGFIDPIINPIPGSMTSNADLDFPGGHKFVEAYLSSSDTLVKIITKTKQLLAGLDTESSQWELDQELNKGTKDYKITLKHRFDTTITSMQDVEVYPFKASEKLYHVKDNTPDGNGWVKASCGGTKVFDNWSGQESDEYYLINNTRNEMLIYHKPCYISSYAYKIYPVKDYIESYYNDRFLMYYYPYDKYLVTTSNCYACNKGYSTSYTLVTSSYEGLNTHDNNVDALIEKNGSLSAVKLRIDNSLSSFFKLPNVDEVSVSLIDTCFN